MRICYVIDSVVASGGAEQSLAGMVPALVALGVDLHVVSLSDAPGLQQRITDGGAELTHLPGRRVPAACADLTRYVRRTRPHLLHTTLARANTVGRVAGALGGVPVVTSLVNVSYGPEYLRDPALTAWKVRLLHALDAASARRVRRYHALTEHVADVMAGRLRYPRHRIDVVPRGRDPEQLGTPSPARRERVRRSLGVTDEPLVLTAARHERQKGLDVALEAFARVRQVLPRARMVMAGREGNQTAALRTAVQAAGLHDCVELLGSRRDVPDLLCAADAFVVPSRWEGLGSVLLEALALQAPVVASDLPPIRETVGDHALLVPPGDPSALAASVLDVLTGPDRARARAVAGAEHFRSRYTLDRVGGEMVAFYERALAG